MTKSDDKRVPALRFKGFTDEWEQRKLKNITKRISRKNLNLDSTLPLTISAQYGLVDQRKFFDKQIASKKLENYLLLKNGEFAYNKSYSKDYPFGAIKRLNNYKLGVLSTLYIAFKPVSINTDYLEEYFDSTKWYKEIYKRATEGARNHGLLNISPQDFFELNLSIPNNRIEQERISKILKKLSLLITLQQRKLERLKSLKKAYLRLIFNTSESIHYLKDIAEYRRGSFPQPYTKREWYGGKDSQPFVQVADVNTNLRLFSKTKETISKKAQQNSVFVPKDTIVVTLQGSIGRVAITQYDSYVDRTLLIITKLKKRIDKYYLAYALQEKFNIEKRKAPGGTIKTITKSTLSNFAIILPNFEKQSQQSQTLKTIDNEIYLINKKLDKLVQFKQFLLQNMFI